MIKHSTLQEKIGDSDYSTYPVEDTRVGHGNAALISAHGFLTWASN